MMEAFKLAIGQQIQFLRSKGYIGHHAEPDEPLPAKIETLIEETFQEYVTRLAIGHTIGDFDIIIRGKFPHLQKKYAVRLRYALNPTTHTLVLRNCHLSALTRPPIHQEVLHPATMPHLLTWEGRVGLQLKIAALPDPDPPTGIKPKHKR